MNIYYLIKIQLYLCWNLWQHNMLSLLDLTTFFVYVQTREPRKGYRSEHQLW
jgi:hypothetical protein